MKELNNKELVARLERLKGRENQIVAELVKYLSEVDRRKLYLELGYPSLFAYCCKALKYSESAAYRRIAAARVYRDNPEVYQKLITGELTLCAVAELSKVLKTENKAELFIKVSGKSKREVQSVVAEYRAPETKIKQQESIRVRQVKKSPAPLLEKETKSTEQPPLKSYSVTLELSEEEMALLHEAQAILSTRKVKDTLLKSAKRIVQQHKRLQAKRECRVVRRESMPPVEVDQDTRPSRYIPADVRHAVEKRDGNRCTYVAPDGRRCCETRNLELDHIEPFALGGKSTVQNLRQVCRGHNQLYAEQVFGREYLQRIVHLRK